MQEIQIHPTTENTLPALVDRAASALMSARDSAEVLEARDMARVAYDAAKSAGRIVRAKSAHDEIIAAVYRAQGHALAIEARAKIRLADEYDAAQERGEVAVQGAHVAGDNMMSTADLGLRRDEIFEARQLRDAELAEPGIVERVIAARTEAREEPTKAALREAVSEANNKHVRGTLGTGENEWYTPSEHLCLVREVLGCIDLDPASSEQAQETIRAGRFFTAEQDGLAHPWEGRVFLNPPYAQPLIAQFVEKLCGEVESGRVSEAVMLTHNYTDTAWFHRAAETCDAICFTRGRVRFVSQDGVLASPTQGQAFFYFGDNRQAFAQVFSSIGFVVHKAEA